MVITQNQGIGLILGSDERTTKSSSSLRRALSADMSSAKWLTQHGLLSPMKKIASSEEFSLSSITDSGPSSWSSEDEGDEQDRETDDQQNKPGQFDIWSSIIQQKSQDFTENKPEPPVYVHPLVKRSSSLTEKSLEICTESLGSETGSDGFSSYPASESGDVTEDEKLIVEPEQQQVIEQQSFAFDQLVVSIPKYNYVAGKKSPPQRSFPPPIPSRRDGASAIRMQSRRDNGRLVLEAVSVPSTSKFLSQRQDGRLVLTFAKTPEVVPKLDKQETAADVEQDKEKKAEAEELDEAFDSFHDDDAEDMESDEAEEEEEEEAAFVMEQAPKLLSSRVIDVHKLTLMGLANRDPTWPNKFNQEDALNPTIVAKSLPPMPRMIPKPTPEKPDAVAATADAAGVGGATFNEYEYYWRPKPMMSNNINNNKNESKNPVGNDQRLLVLRGMKGDHSVPRVKSCKETRRSLLFWEPHCIATS